MIMHFLSHVLSTSQEIIQPVGGSLSVIKHYKRNPRTQPADKNNIKTQSTQMQHHKQQVRY